MICQFFKYKHKYCIEFAFKYKWKYIQSNAISLIPTNEDTPCQLHVYKYKFEHISLCDKTEIKLDMRHQLSWNDWDFMNTLYVINYRYTFLFWNSSTYLSATHLLCIIFMAVCMWFVLFLACVFFCFIRVINVVWYNDSSAYNDFYIYQLLVNFSFLHLYRNIILNVFCSSIVSEVLCRVFQCHNCFKLFSRILSWDYLFSVMQL